MSIIFEQIVKNDQALVIKTKSNIIGRGKIKNFHSLNVCGSFLKFERGPPEIIYSWLQFNDLYLYKKQL